MYLFSTPPSVGMSVGSFEVDSTSKSNNSTTGIVIACLGGVGNYRERGIQKKAKLRPDEREILLCPSYPPIGEV